MSKPWDGRPPPNSLDVERAVLLAVLLDVTSFDRLAGTVQAEHFYSEAHRWIWTAALELHQAKRAGDIVTTAEWLRDRGRLEQVGGMTYLVELMNGVAAIANIKGHARQLVNLARLRKAIDGAHEFMARAYHSPGDIDELLARFRDRWAAVVDAGRSSAVEDNLAVLKAEILRIRNGPDGSAGGLGTGLKSYDALTGGLHPKEVTVVAARPGVGKSALLTQWASHISGEGIGVGFISLEMSREDMVRRILSGEARVNSDRLRRHTISQTEFAAIVSESQRFSTRPFWINETPALNIHGVREAAYAFMDHGRATGKPLGVIFLDYLQYVAPRPGQERATPQQYLPEVTRGIAALAKELALPIVCAAALNRDVDKRTGAVRKPRMSDIRDCGTIESDAHNIIFLHRAARVNEEGRDVMENNGIVELIVEKQRNGPRDEVLRLRFRGEYTRFYDMDGSQ